MTRLARAYNIAAPASAASCPGCGRAGPLPAEEVLRCGPQHRKRRLPDHHLICAGGNRLQDGRGDFRGVQGTGNMELACPASWRTSDCSGHRHQRFRHPPRGAHHQPAGTADYLPSASTAGRHGAEQPTRRWCRASRRPPPTATSSPPSCSRPTPATRSTATDQTAEQ